MTYCIKESTPCIGRDCRDLTEISAIARDICCKDEIKEEKEIALSVLDCIEDCSRTQESLIRVTSRLSFAASTINGTHNHEVQTVLSVIRRFATLAFSKKEEILQDMTLGNLVCTFVQELKGWFAYNFLLALYPHQYPIQTQSLLADIETIEMAFGACALTYQEALLDDLFF